MAQKVVLGARPTILRRIVEVLMPDGEIGTIRVDYKYRTRREFADFVDALIKRADDELKAAIAAQAKAAQAQATAAEQPAAAAAKPRRGAKADKAAAVQAPARITERGSVDQAIGVTTDQLMDIIVGWDLDTPFNRSAVEQLCDELPAAAQALSAGYRKAVNEGHSGN